MTPVRRRYLGWILIGLPVFLVVAVLVVIMQAKAFLRSDRFRTFLGDKVSRSVHARGGFKPLQWSGSSFYSDAFTAAGEPGGSLESIDAEQMRAEVNLQGLWERKWQVESVEIERLSLVPGLKKRIDVISEQARAVPKPSASPKNTAPATPGFFSSLLPDQVDVQRVTVADFRLDGRNLQHPFALTGVKVEAKPDDKAWMLQASGGSLRLARQPGITLGELAVRYVEGTLFINHGNFTVAGGGAATVSGKISEKPAADTDLHVKLDHLPAATVLPKDWRAQLHGLVSADLHAVGDGREWTISGPVTLTEGRLEALPVLDQVAMFTRTQRFRQLNLETVHADVVVKDNHITVSNLNAESPGLLRMTGGFVVENGEMIGNFLVGVTPASLRWIPGSQTKVFTEEHDGYLWTPMKITGPLAHLTEDLSTRLAVAAGQDLINTIQNDPSKLKDTLKDAAESLLDLFRK